MQSLLELVNVILTSGIVIFSFAILLYLVIYNFRSPVARSFVALLASVLLTYFVDLALVGVGDLETAAAWLRIQWIGIAFTPAAYLGFSNALLATTGDRSRLRDVAVRVSYLLSASLLLLVAFSDLLVRGVEITHHAAHLLPGTLFFLFTLYFLAAVGWGVANAFRARRRCLTSTSRRRMTYLMATFAAPAAGVFPYLLLARWPPSVPGGLLWGLLVLGNISIGGMLVLLAYSVAFFGALTPDRVIKHRLIRFLLRGPFVAVLVVVVITAASQAEGWMGLPSRRVMLFGVVAVILLLQLVIESAKPLIDRALYRQDQPEIAWIQELGNRLLTTTDLRQFLENVLAALCDLLRVNTAFIAVVEQGVPRLEVVCGSLNPPLDEDFPAETLTQPSDGRRVRRYGDLFTWNGYWLVPLCSYPPSGDGDVIGMLGVAARAPEPDLSPDEQAGLEALLTQAAAALEDRQLQQGIFGALEHIIPEIEDIQRRRGVVRYTGEKAISGFSLVEADEFRLWVRDALKHYWGGPKLADNPLLSLHVVERAAQEHDGNVMNALRAVLRQAIERLRPDGQRQMTGPEWLLYNILELKFLQGRRVREVARRLAMSESDLYRKQRVAIEAVAQTLAEMEREELSRSTGERPFDKKQKGW